MPEGQTGERQVWESKAPEKLNRVNRPLKLQLACGSGQVRCGQQRSR